MILTGEEEKRSLADQAAERTIGAAIAVHETLGPGFSESIYAQALSIELEVRGLRHRREHAVGLRYRDQTIGEGRIDLLVEDVLIVELKTVESLLAIHTAQVISYLKMTSLPVGLLINFNVAVLKQGLRRVTHPALYRTARLRDSSSSPSSVKNSRSQTCPPTI